LTGLPTVFLDAVFLDAGFVAPAFFDAGCFSFERFVAKGITLLPGTR
jgi:hypothetical protein